MNELSASEWDIVRNISGELTRRGVDRNELGKAGSFFRQDRSKDRFLILLDRLPNSEFIRSNRTREYFEHIHRVCSQQLAELDDERALDVVSWAFRLMSYYQMRRI